LENTPNRAVGKIRGNMPLTASAEKSAELTLRSIDTMTPGYGHFAETGLESGEEEVVFGYTMAVNIGS
jgi:hypothetical protein